MKAKEKKAAKSAKEKSAREGIEINIEGKKEEPKKLDITNIDERIKEINENKGFVLAVSVNKNGKRTDSSLSMKGISANDVLAEIEKFKIAFLFGTQKNQQQQMQEQKPKEEEHLSYAQ